MSSGADRGLKAWHQHHPPPDLHLGLEAGVTAATGPLTGGAGGVATRTALLPLQAGNQGLQE